MLTSSRSGGDAVQKETAGRPCSAAQRQQATAGNSITFRSRVAGRTGGADAGARLPSVLHANDIRYGRHDAELASVEEQRQLRRQVMA